MSAIYRKVNGEWRQATSGQIYNGTSWQSKTIDETISYIQGKLIDNGEHYNKFTLSYDLNGGTGTLNGQTVYSTAMAHAFIIPSTPNISREHYDFTGWLDQDGNNLQAHNQLILTVDKKDSTAIAQWLAQYHITYNINAPSGTSPSLSKTEEYVSALNNSTTVLPNPSMADYKFLGWYTNPNDESSRVASGGATYQPTQNIDLYARWVRVYTITYWKTILLNPAAALLFTAGGDIDKRGPIDRVSHSITYPEDYRNHFNNATFDNSWNYKYSVVNNDLKDINEGRWDNYDVATSPTPHNSIQVPEGTVISFTLSNNYNNGSSNNRCKVWQGICEYGDDDAGAVIIAGPSSPLNYSYTVNKDTAIRLNWRTEGDEHEAAFDRWPPYKDTRDSWWDIYIY